MGRVTSFFHAGITVRDMDTSLRYYCEGLGLEPYFDKVLDGPYLREVLNLPLTSLRAAYLNIPNGGFVELLEYRGLERLSAASRPCDFGAGHLCFYVEGIDEIVARLHSMGYVARSSNPVNVTSGPNAGARSIYGLDPDGYAVELFQRPTS